MQESITPEAADPPGALSLQTPPVRICAYNPKQGTVWVTSQLLPNSLKKKEDNLSFEL